MILLNLQDKDQNLGKRNKSKEYYVKGADLIAEIKKYQDSKLTNPDR